MSNKEKTQKQTRTYIGGQAVLEGVMMRGKTAYATAVRDPEGNIQIESRRLNLSKGMKRAAKIPVVRGVVNFVASLVTGSKILMRSAEVYELIGSKEVSSFLGFEYIRYWRNHKSANMLVIKLLSKMYNALLKFKQSFHKPDEMAVPVSF